MDMPIGTNRWTTFQICAGRKSGAYGHHRGRLIGILEALNHTSCASHHVNVCPLKPLNCNQVTFMGFLRTPIRRLNPSFSPLAGRACFLHSWDQEHREQAPRRPENGEWQSSGQNQNYYLQFLLHAICNCNVHVTIMTNMFY